MRVIYKGDIPQIQLAVEDANDLFTDDTFYGLISERAEFNCANVKPAQIAEFIRTSTLEVEVRVYKPRWPWSDVLGYFVSKYPTTIFLNARKLYRETNSITNTIIHEYVHALDNHIPGDINFGHDCDSFENTAPYEIGKIAELLINGYVKESFIESENSIIIEDYRIIE